MRLVSMRAFSTELIKIATEIKDPDIRALLAEKRGKEYLQGGQLKSNTERETNFIPKLASLSDLNPMTTPMDRLRSEQKKPGGYQTARDSALSGLGGSLTGIGINRAVEQLRGSTHLHGPRSYRIAAGIGAGVGVADRLYRHHKVEKKAMMSSQTFTPGRALHEEHQTGRFENVIHKGPGVKPALLGKAGCLPKS